MKFAWVNGARGEREQNEETLTFVQPAPLKAFRGVALKCHWLAPSGQVKVKLACSQNVANYAACLQSRWPGIFDRRLCLT